MKIKKVGRKFGRNSNDSAAEPRPSVLCWAYSAVLCRESTLPFMLNRTLPCHTNTYRVVVYPAVPYRISSGIVPCAVAQRLTRKAPRHPCIAYFAMKIFTLNHEAGAQGSNNTSTMNQKGVYLNGLQPARCKALFLLQQPPSNIPWCLV